MGDIVTSRQDQPQALATITSADVQRAVDQANLVADVVKRLMQPDVHFGTVPGVKKAFLWQPGAQKLALAFGLTAEYEYREVELPGGHREYVTLCRLIHRPTGAAVGECAGVCSTMESKYRYRGAAGKPCPSCGENAMKRGKAEFGGGYYCDKRLGGCGSNYKAGTPEAAQLDKVQQEGRLENPDLADTYHTVRQMSQKRAFVGAVRAATACSDIFDYDPDSVDQGPPREPQYREPQRRQEPPRQQTGQQRPPQEDRGPTPPVNNPTNGPRLISEPQRKRLFAICKDRSIPHEKLKAHLEFVHGITTTADIPTEIYEAVCTWAENGGYSPGEEPT